MAIAPATATMSSDALYRADLASYQAKAARWANMPPPAPTAAPRPANDLNLAAADPKDAYPEPPKPKAKKKSCMDKTIGVFGKIAKVALPVVVGFFTGGPVGAAMGAVQGAGALSKK